MATHGRSCTHRRPWYDNASAHCPPCSAGGCAVSIPTERIGPFQASATAAGDCRVSWGLPPKLLSVRLNGLQQRHTASKQNLPRSFLGREREPPLCQIPCGNFSHVSLRRPVDSPCYPCRAYSYCRSHLLSDDVPALGRLFPASEQTLGEKSDRTHPYPSGRELSTARFARIPHPHGRPDSPASI